MKKTAIAVTILMFGMLTISYGQATPAKTDKNTKTTKDKPVVNKSDSGTKQSPNVHQTKANAVIPDDCPQDSLQECSIGKGKIDLKAKGQNATIDDCPKDSLQECTISKSTEGSKSSIGPTSAVDKASPKLLDKSSPKASGTKPQSELDKSSTKGIATDENRVLDKSSPKGAKSGASKKARKKGKNKKQKNRRKKN